MELTINGITIEYDRKDGNLAIEILKQLEQKSEKIMKFFEQKEVKDFRIKIWNDYEAFKVFTLPYLQENNEAESISWVTAHTFDDNINMLPKRYVSKIWKRDVSDEELAIDACHEFVHICHMRYYGKNDCENTWFWEALATNLGNPENFEWVNDEYDKYVDWKKFSFNNFKDSSYKYVYCIGNYMLKNLEHKKVLEYVKTPKVLKSDEDKILKDAIIYSNKTFSQKAKQNYEPCNSK